MSTLRKNAAKVNWNHVGMPAIEAGLSSRQGAAKGS